MNTKLNAAKAVPNERLLNEKSEARIQQSITIHKVDPKTVYEFWRNFSNLAKFMKDIQSIEMLSHDVSKWNLHQNSGVSASWTAKVTADRVGSYIAWESIDGDLETNGAVSFAPAQGIPGTVVNLAMNYKVPGGKLAEVAAALTGESPEMLILTNLKRLRALLETGEIASTLGQPSGRSDDATSLKN